MLYHSFKISARFKCLEKGWGRKNMSWQKLFDTPFFVYLSRPQWERLRLGAWGGREAVQLPAAAGIGEGAGSNHPGCATDLPGPAASPRWGLLPASEADQLHAFPKHCCASPLLAASHLYELHFPSRANCAQIPAIPPQKVRCTQRMPDSWRVATIEPRLKSNAACWEVRCSALYLPCSISLQYYCNEILFSSSKAVLTSDRFKIVVLLLQQHSDRIFFSHSIKHTQMLWTWESCSPRHLLLRSGKLSCFFWDWFLRLGNVACGSKVENTTAYPPMLTVWGNRLQLSVNRKVALSCLYSHANCFTWVFQQYDALNPIWDIRPGVHCRW